METKHTPGPWKTDGFNVQMEHGKTNWENFVCANDEKRETFNAMINGIDSKVSYANALIIAAAPELLTACKMVLRYVETCPRCEGSGMEYYQTTDACNRCGGTGKVMNDALTSELHLVEQAIAKAEGKK